MTIKQLPISIPRGFWSEYGVRGKYTAIAFICQRCGYSISLLETQEMRDKSEGNLQSYEVPEGWSDHNYIGVMCPTCTKEFNEFMKMKEGETE